MISPAKLLVISIVSTSAFLTGLPAEAADGPTLAKSNQCMSCHAIDKKLLGPAFSEVSAKYRGDAGAVSVLAASIKAGSKGKWGTMPMPPNPRISDDDLQVLAVWILSQ